MNIQEALPIFERQKIIGKPREDRALHESGIAAMDAAISDQKNYGANVVQCVGCGFVSSELLTINGCPNCGVDELTTEIDA